MTDLVINELLAEWIRALARQQCRSPEELLVAWVEHHDRESDPHNLPPRPPESLTDGDIEGRRTLEGLIGTIDSDIPDLSVTTLERI